MKKPSQKQQVLSILKRNGSISNHYCIDTRLTTRLGAIIHKLRNEGNDITSKMDGRDCIYTLHRKVVMSYRIPLLDKTIEVYG